MDVTARLVYSWFRRIVEAQYRGFRPNVIYVTEASQCLRKSFYDRKSMRPILDVRNVILTFGNGVHYQLQKLLEGEGWSSEVEASWDLGRFKLVGHADLYHPRENVVLEVKTVGKVPSKPYNQHVTQLNAYLSMLKAGKGYIIYIGRDGQVKVYNVKPDKKLWSQTIKRAFKLYYSLQEGKPPQPEFSPLCFHCPFKWSCFSRGEKP